MGMDDVEIILAVEEHFGIQFSNDECLQIRTVGDMVAICQQRLLARTIQRCPSLACFFQLRKLVRETTDQPLLRIRPSTRVDVALSPQARSELWPQLPRVLRQIPPPLRVPRAIVALTIAAYLCATVALIATVDEFAISLWLIAPYYWLATRFRRVPPPGYTTFGELTQRMVELQVATKSSFSVEPEAILAELRPLIVAVLGVKPSEIVPTARFVEDLGVS